MKKKIVYEKNNYFIIIYNYRIKTKIQIFLIYFINKI